MMAIRALVTARLPRAMAPRFAAVSHLQQLQQSAIARAAFSTNSNGSDDDDAVVAPVVEENGAIASIPITQVRHARVQYSAMAIDWY